MALWSPPIPCHGTLLEFKALVPQTLWKQPSCSGSISGQSEPRPQQEKAPLDLAVNSCYILSQHSPLGLYDFFHLTLWFLALRSSFSTFFCAHPSNPPWKWQAPVEVEGTDSFLCPYLHYLFSFSSLWPTHKIPRPHPRKLPTECLQLTLSWLEMQWLPQIILY